MKKTLFFLMLFAASFGMQAQNKIGLKVFPEFSSVYGSSSFADITDGLITFGGGLQVVHKLIGPLHIESGVYLTNRGMDGSAINITNGQGVIIAFGDAKYSYSYVSVPVQARLELGPIYLAAGPQVDFLYDAEISYTTILGSFTNVDEDAANFMVSGLVTAGFELGLTDRFKFFVEGRGNAQLTELYQFDGAPQLSNLGLGVGFNIGL